MAYAVVPSPNIGSHDPGRLHGAHLAQAGLNTGRLIGPNEVAVLVLPLASGRVRNSNGSDYVFDGGQSKTA